MSDQCIHKSHQHYQRDNVLHLLTSSLFFFLTRSDWQDGVTEFCLRSLNVGYISAKSSDHYSSLLSKWHSLSFHFVPLSPCRCSRLCVWWANWWESAGTPTRLRDWLHCGSRKRCLSCPLSRTSKISCCRADQRRCWHRCATTGPGAHREKLSSSYCLWLPFSGRNRILREPHQVVAGAKVHILTKMLNLW